MKDSEKLKNVYKKFRRVKNKMVRNFPVVSIEEIKLTAKIKRRMDSFSKKRADENAKKIRVHKFFYKSGGHNVVGFLAEPKKGGKKLPVVICNRGGFREFGAIEEHHLFTRWMARFAGAGYIAIASQYSGNSGSEGKDKFGGRDIDDVLNLYQLLKKYKRADINRIGMYGFSRGGMMTYIALSKVKWIKAAIVHAGPTNLLKKENSKPEMEEYFRKMFGGSLAEKKKRSVISWVNKLPKKTPILIIHGTADRRVSAVDSLELSEKLYSHKIPHRLIIYEGGDHDLSEFRKEVGEEKIRWFDRFVKNPKPVMPNLKPHGE